MGLLRRLRPGKPVMLTGATGARGHSVTESFRRLRSALQFIGNADDERVFIVTSADAKEGKSTVSSNLAVALAKAGSSVALVSADMRRPSLEERFGVDPPGPGLADHLLGVGTVQPTAIEEVPGLWIVPAGSLPPNPGELLSSEAFAQLVTRFQREIDFIIIDTPPILAAADALAAASHGASVIMVADVKSTETDDLARARAELERAGVRVRGAVANRLPHRRSGLFGRRNYGYYQPTKARTKAKVA
jgi:capsular exopolysaccharide synthesis family protein